MSEVDPPLRSEKTLWLDYLFLTKEMAKRISGQEFDLFFELMQQRDAIEEEVDRLKQLSQKSEEFPERLALLGQIKREDDAMRFLFGKHFNKLKSHHRVSTAYQDSINDIGIGRRFDKLE